MNGKAIVIGGSIAGLLAARILANFFSEVIVIDKDRLPLTPETRKGVPQSVQPHVLFAKGYRILEDLFPGIGVDLAKQGAIKIDWVKDFFCYGMFGWSFNVKNYANLENSDIVSVTCSRPLLESVIRQQLTRFTPIKIKQNCKVTGLIKDDNESKIIGIRFSKEHETQQQLFADLIVDASGRGSNSSQWLEELGFQTPPKTIINPYLGYATCRYKQPQENLPDWKVLLISHVPPNNTRLGYLATIENGELIATLGGYGKDFPPLEEKGFLEFAKSLPAPDFYNIISQAEILTPIYAHRATANRLRHFEKIRLPQGFIAIGDSVCALCPVYGQGMTVAALGAKVLEKCLKKAKGYHNFQSQNFQSKLAAQLYFPWTLATTQDSKFTTTKTTKGKFSQSNFDKLMAWYSHKLMLKSSIDPKIHKKFTEVAQCLKSPLSFYNPMLVLQVLLK